MCIFCEVLARTGLSSRLFLGHLPDTAGEEAAVEPSGAGEAVEPAPAGTETEVLPPADGDVALPVAPEATGVDMPGKR